MYVCLSVALSARMSEKPHVQILPNLLYVLHVAMAESSSDSNAIRCVLPVLWIRAFHFPSLVEAILLFPLLPLPPPSPGALPPEPAKGYGRAL